MQIILLAYYIIIYCFYIDLMALIVLDSPNLARLLLVFGFLIKFALLLCAVSNLITSILYRFTSFNIDKHTVPEG
jgi:hypothetical protein